MTKTLQDIETQPSVPKHSLTRVISRTMTLMVVMAALAISVSILTLLQSHSDARAINVSGSLRMQNYRMAYSIETKAPEAEIQAKIVAFEHSLHEPALAKLLDRNTPPPLKRKYQAILDEWQVLKAHLTDPAKRPLYLAEVKSFVDRIDKLVFLLQSHLEDKVAMLVLFEAICLLVLLATAVFAIRFVSNQVVQPLKLLLHAAYQVKRGDFSVKVKTGKADELGLLSDAFNDMAADLAKLYEDLNQKVAEKTEKLHLANNTLSVLFQCSEAVHVSHVDDAQITELMNKIIDNTRINAMQATINPQLAHALRDRSSVGDMTVGGPRVCFALYINDISLGHLELISAEELDENELRLMSTFSRLISKVLHVELLLQQEQQLLLMEERSIIARELHDSLAQSLSYLKIQLTLLRRATQDVEGPSSAIMADLNTGLNSAYRQLRELLSTFRLSVKDDNLKTAISTVLKQLQPQTEAQLQLDYRVSEYPLPPHQYIHVLQIVREAVINAIKHADAKQIFVRCVYDGEGKIDIQVEDDGKGIGGEVPNKLHHYGVAIMKERAESLDGELEIANKPDGGTLVSLCFPAVGNSVT
ncbi:nitrate/nitrite two-component system sensor histidine kinase NarQ [Corallincola luteus]|uniref:Sensor protein n=1 Tax=Corallincola luteus TaxID=1775177 RepID=A0ABY2ARV8_9GAMM|nr:nitrate/nitrite two-component system sensor histidine kinase NarQ [Corallincola luteus]TCI04842.1 nitrate/nitrite two-component system sensor histidine kinase NarQ [Corallincola luteus]